MLETTIHIYHPQSDNIIITLPARGNLKSMAVPQLLLDVFSAQIVDKIQAESTNRSRIHHALAMIYGTTLFNHDEIQKTKTHDLDDA
jgi:hypothetical protein